MFNDLISFFESKQWVWSTGGVSHGQRFITQLQECLWYVDGHHHAFADCYHPIPSLYLCPFALASRWYKPLAHAF